VTRDEARAVLGVAPDATAEDVRTAFRDLVRRFHPDVAGASGGPRTRDAIAAYRVLCRSPADPQPSKVVHHVAVRDIEVIGDIVLLTLPADEAFLALLDASHELGEVAYVDRAVGLLETVVTFLEWPVCSGGVDGCARAAAGGGGRADRRTPP
jgi:hypothetical protein